MNKNIKSAIMEAEMYFPEDSVVRNNNTLLNIVKASWNLRVRVAYMVILLLVALGGYATGKIAFNQENNQHIGIEAYLNDNFDYYLPVPIDCHINKKVYYSLYYAENDRKQYNVIHSNAVDVMTMLIVFNGAEHSNVDYSDDIAILEVSSSYTLLIECVKFAGIDLSYTIDTSLYANLLVKSHK